MGPSDVQPFLQDLARRFDPDNEIDGILGPVVHDLCFHESLFRPEGLAGGDASWRGVIGGLEALISVKSIANMIPRLEEFNPPTALAHTIETVSLFGPILRMGVFEREWVCQLLPLLHACLSLFGSLRLPRHTSSRRKDGLLRICSLQQPVYVGP